MRSTRIVDLAVGTRIGARACGVIMDPTKPSCRFRPSGRRAAHPDLAWPEGLSGPSSPRRRSWLVTAAGIPSGESGGMEAVGVSACGRGLVAERYGTVFPRETGGGAVIGALDRVW
ncbi:MAG: hypothetical protein J0I07_30400 [Myxococcales bacterium]|nr:hypothetical protein [Myxococcales bacterium]